MYVVAFIRQKLILLTLDAHECGIRKIIITTIVLSLSPSICLFINTPFPCFVYEIAQM